MKDPAQSKPPSIALPSLRIPVLQPISWLKVFLLTILGSIFVTGTMFIGIQIGKEQAINQQIITAQMTKYSTKAVSEPVTLPTEENFTSTTPGVKFMGVITEINDGCWSDGICSIRVGDRWVIAEIGGLKSPDSEHEVRGELVGVSFEQKYVGKTVEVYAKKLSSDNYSMYGDLGYYIKIID